MSDLTLAEVARVAAGTSPDRIAIVFDSKKTSAGLLDLHANQVANGLWDLGLLDQDRVAILDYGSDHFYEIWLGAARTNVALTPLNTRLSIPEIAQVLADCKPRVLFVGVDFAESIAQIRAQLPFVEHVITMGTAFVAWRDEQSTVAAPATLSASDDCLQIYTSGTTGIPKGVQLTSDNIFKAPLCALASEQKTPCRDIGPDDVVLLCLPHAHVAGSILGAFGLARGARLVITKDFVPSEIVSLIERERVTVTMMVPVMIRGLIAEIERSKRPCASLKTVLYGAAPMATSLLKKVMEILPHSGFGQIYGLTETAGGLTYLSADDHRAIATGNSDLAISCGSASAGVEIRIVNALGQPVSTGEIGEIICRSTSVMKGYWERPEETKTAIRDGWFYTGDMGYLDHGEYLYICDRKRDMIITGGENVYPAEVENILFSHPAIEDVAIVGVPDEQWGECVTAVAVVKPGASVSADELIAYARSKIAGFKIPKSVDFVQALPRNATGKVMRRLIKERYWIDQGRGIA
jgi:acyl-CoA synthetase (AMP-forming)/AMP-acid ligase II